MRAAPFLFLLVSVSLASAQDPKDAPKVAKPPTAEELTKADALITEIYSGDIAKAGRDPAALSKLAARMLKDARETTDDRAGRQRLLVVAEDVARKAGDVPLAFEIAEVSLGHLGVPMTSSDAMARKVAILATVEPADRRTFVDTALSLADEAEAIDDFAGGRRALDLALKSAVAAKSVILVTEVRRQLADFERSEQEFAEYRPYAEQLAKNPRDAVASRQMGLYQALVKDNWPAALPLLAAGDDADWRAPAQAELAGPKTAAAKFALAQAWLKARPKAPAAARPLVDLRAVLWYQSAASESGDAELRLKARNQIEWIMDNVPADFRVGEIASEWRRCEGHLGPAYDVVFDGKRLVSVGADGDVRLWNPSTGKLTRRLPGTGTRLWAVALSENRVLTGGFDGVVRLWDALGRQPPRVIGKHGDYVRSVGFSADGKIAFSAGDDRAIRLWDVAAGKQIKSLDGHDHFIWSAALSTDGKRILSGSHDRTARLWDVSTGQTIRKLAGHTDAVLAVAFSPDSRYALTGSADRTLKWWDLETGSCLATFDGHTGYVHSVSISPDGRRALSASQDRTLRLWDIASGETIRVLEGGADQMWSVAFAPGGRQATSVGNDGAVRIWGGPRPAVDLK